MEAGQHTNAILLPVPDNSIISAENIINLTKDNIMNTFGNTFGAMLLICISVLALSAGFYFGAVFMADRIEQREQKINRLILKERMSVEILSQYYGNGIKRLDKIPADSLDLIIKKAGF